MKKKTITVAALLTVISAAGFGQNTGTTGDSQVRIVTQQQSDKYRVIYKSEIEGPVKLTLSDEDGHILYKERHSKLSSFIQDISFESVSTGEYTFQVEDLAGSHKETISFVSQEDRLASKLRLAQESGKKLVLRATDLGYVDLSLYIYDDKNQLIYDENLKDVDVLGKIYNLDLLASRSVNVVIANDHKRLLDMNFSLE
ncbi:MAG: hypothetical protein O2887_16140 [Bacteroidetes bacterium]|nr:hypothetical protein [Bacteroidota bacterium]MDA1121993.1 hypothetical protein [Bacteroidota bacterium]